MPLAISAHSWSSSSRLLCLCYGDLVDRLASVLGQFGDGPWPLGHFICPPNSTHVGRCYKFSNFSKDLSVERENSVSQHPAFPYLSGSPP